MQLSLALRALGREAIAAAHALPAQAATLEQRAMQALTARGWQPDYLTVRRRADLQRPPERRRAGGAGRRPPGAHAVDRQFRDLTPPPPLHHGHFPSGHPWIATGVFVLNAKQQRQRVVLLASYRATTRSRSWMENLTEGYLRALGESDPERREQVWNLLRTTELQLSEQFTRFTADFTVSTPRWPASAPCPGTALCRPVAAERQLRHAPGLAIHAQGIERAVRNESGLSLRDKAYTLSAELFLMQHTCHWFCKSWPLPRPASWPATRPPYPGAGQRHPGHTRRL